MKEISTASPHQIKHLLQFGQYLSFLSTCRHTLYIETAAFLSCHSFEDSLAHRTGHFHCKQSRVQNCRLMLAVMRKMLYHFVAVFSVVSVHVNQFPSYLSSLLPLYIFWNELSLAGILKQSNSRTEAKHTSGLCLCKIYEGWHIAKHM